MQARVRSPEIEPTSSRPARAAANGVLPANAVKLNLGCGPVQPGGWINVDDSNRAWLASRLPFLDRLLVKLRVLPATEFNSGLTYFNLEKRFPWPDNSVHAVYLGEILEHFTLEHGEHVCRESYRVLAPGGVIRIRVPDNARFWERYLQEYNQVRQRPRSEWTLEHTRWTRMFFQTICVHKQFLGSMGHFHKWMYDDVSLIKLLEAAGFRDVNRAPYLQSRIADVAAVEARDDLIVEAVK